MYHRMYIYILYIPTPGHNTSHFGLLFRLYYRYNVNNQCTTTICAYRVHSKQLFPITHSSTCIFPHFGCSFLHVFQGAFLRSNPWGSSWAHEQPKSLPLGAVRHAVKEFTHRVYLVIDLDTALVAISCEHQNLARTVTVPFWGCRPPFQSPLHTLCQRPSAVCSPTVKKCIVQKHQSGDRAEHGCQPALFCRSQLCELAIRSTNIILNTLCNMEIGTKNQSAK